jgi:spoIIIJ-associated protein
VTDDIDEPTAQDPAQQDTTEDTTEETTEETTEGAGEDLADQESAGSTDDDSGGEPDRLKVLEREGDIAADYLEELLDIADLDGDLDMDVEGDRASVSIVGADLSQLVGRNGEVLEALQELTRLAVLRETGERSRLMLDVSGHRAERRAVLEGVARDAVEQVKASGEPVSLKPMTPFERKVVHDVVAGAGLASDSEGVEPRRYVVVRPA